MPVILDSKGQTGTSGAAPHAAGTAALILSKLKGLWSEDVEWMVEKSADHVAPGYDLHYGWGRLDAGNLFRTLLNPAISNGKMYSYIDFYQAPELSLVWVGRTIFYGGNLDPRVQYDSECYRAIYHVSFPDRYSSILGAWGKTFAYVYGELWETVPWSASNPNFCQGYCEVVPGTETPAGCDIRTYFFKVFVNGQWQWYPHDPSQYTMLCYSVWGIKYNGNPTGPDQGKKSGQETIVFNDKCYPNPSNSGFNIDFELAIDERIELSVFDILGRRAKVLDAGTLAKGAHSIKWDGSDDSGKELPSGIYFYRIASQDFNKIGQMVITK